MKNSFAFHDHKQLSAFFGAYLHQDFDLDYATPEAALDDFKKHSTQEQFAAFATEFQAFMAAVEHASFAEVQSWWVHKMGSGWMPSDKNTLLALQKHVVLADTK
jgi:hypothetical protein